MVLGLGDMLELNAKHTHKRLVALEKIHPVDSIPRELDPTPLIAKSGLKTLPQVVDWYDRAETAIAREKVHACRQLKLCAIFHFVREQPMHCVLAPARPRCGRRKKNVMPLAGKLWMLCLVLRLLY